jgi:hypothetical protein
VPEMTDNPHALGLANYLDRKRRTAALPQPANPREDYATRAARGRRPADVIREVEN